MALLKLADHLIFFLTGHEPSFFPKRAIFKMHMIVKHFYQQEKNNTPKIHDAPSHPIFAKFPLSSLPLYQLVHLQATFTLQTYIFPYNSLKLIGKSRFNEIHIFNMFYLMT